MLVVLPGNSNYLTQIDIGGNQMPRKLLRLASLFAVVMLLSQSLAQGELPAWEAVSPERLANPLPGDWINQRRTADAAGFSPLDQINDSNVHQLTPVWAFSVRDTGWWAPTPVVANGRLFVSETARVYAFNAVTGKLLWQYTRPYPEDIALSQAYDRERGVAVAGDRVYWGTADSYLVALDAQTGELIWEVQTGDYTLGGGHSHPPLIVEDTILLGRNGGERTTIGRSYFDAYDLETGALKWRFYTVPAAEGDLGAETWADPSTAAGGAPWHTSSFDPELRLVYFGTGQPTPWSAFMRGGGDNLYTNSIIAVDIDTGELRWAFQVVPEDYWDFDSPYENILTDMVIDGEPRKVLFHTTKPGWGIVLDRATGEFLHSFRTGVDNVFLGFEDDGTPIYNPEVLPSVEDIDSGKVYHVCPYAHGVRALQAMSYNAEVGVFYLGTNQSCMDASYVSTSSQGASLRVKLVDGYEHVGEFKAINPATGETLWTYISPSGAPMSAGALATGGNIVFGGTVDRQFFALNATTGELLWDTVLNGDVTGAPVTFEVDAKQYVAVAAGGSIGPSITFARLLGIQSVQGSGVVWVFALPDHVSAEAN